MDYFSDDYLREKIKIKDKKIDNYQLIVPSTWNASPRDSKGQRSAYEASLIGTEWKRDV